MNEDNEFEIEDFVTVTNPMSPFIGMTGTILRPTGPGIVKFGGLSFAFGESYHVFIHGYGSKDLMNGTDLIFPVEFLQYAEPSPEEPVERSTWDAFEAEMEKAGCPGLVNIIKQGSKA